MAMNIEDIKRLKDLTGVGLTDAKRIAELENVINTYESIEQNKTALKSAQDMIKAGGELAELAELEITRAEVIAQRKAEKLFSVSVAEPVKTSQLK